jgi:2-(3-amino-3-carboxypropyl)histidine synthase
MIRLDLEKALRAIRESGARIVAVQVPEGLKQRLVEIASEMEEKTGAKTVSFVSPCYGACDLKDAEAKALGAQLLVHFGHLQFVEKPCIPTTYVPLEYAASAKETMVLAEKLAALLKKNGFKKIVLCSTIQFGNHRALLKKGLVKKGFSVFEGKGGNVEKGQVLGCNYSGVKAVEARAEAVVFVGDGLFHPIGLGFAANKPVFVANPLEREAFALEKQRDLFLRKRIAMVEKARQAKTVAIWVSTKKGQQRAGLALALKGKFEGRGKIAFVFASDFISPDYILGIRAEAIVCTACPRIALDDSSQFGVPIINAAEALIVLGEKKAEEYAFDELL